MKGVLIVALGNPLYVEYAVNLAASIRATSDVNITLIHSDNLTEINAGQKFAFHKRIVCPKEYYSSGSYVEAKLWADKLTPYEQTLLLDADTLCSPYKNVLDLMNELEGTEFKMICRGESNKSDFVQVEHIKKEFDLTKWYDLSSELIYFESTDIFESARAIYDELPNKCWYQRFANGQPDEPSLTIATIKKFDTIDTFMPSYWEYVSGVNLKNVDIYNKFYILSIGGNVIPPKTTKIYNEMVKYYQQKTGVHTFTLRAKSRVLKERKTI